MGFLTTNKTTALEKWLYAVNEQNIDSLCALYLPNAVMIPAMPDTILNTATGIREYFTFLLQKENLYAELLDCKVTRDNGHVINTGNYQLTWTENGEKFHAVSKFSFVTVNYKILVHHASA